MNTGKLLATRGYVVGIEISSRGTRQSVALADLNGNILHRRCRSLEDVPDTQTALSLIDEMLLDLTQADRLRDGRVLRVGVAVGGLVDAAQGVVRTLHHAPGWDDFPLQDYFAAKLDRPCIIDNNANAAALAETQQGIGKGERVVLYVSIGRGIGGALVVNGKVYHGITCMAGEIGHMLAQENGPQCSCGGRGHLEAVASARAIEKTMIELSAEYPATDTAIKRITRGHVESLQAEQVFYLASEGDKIAQQLVDQVCHYFSIALTNIVHLVNPSMIILEGSVAQAGNLFIAPLLARMQQLCHPAAYQPLHLVQGSLGSEANLVGAVTLALQDL